MSTDFPPTMQSEPKTCYQAVFGSSLMSYDSSKKRDERLEVVSTTNPPGTSSNVTGSINQDTGDIVACSTITEANNPKNVIRKKGFRSFFRNPWKTIKSFRQNKVGPYPNPADPKLVPAPPNIKAANESHVADPESPSDPSNLKAADESHLANPEPPCGSSNHKAADEPHSVDPELDTSVFIKDHYPKQLKLSVTEEKGGKRVSIFLRKLKALKYIFKGKKRLSAMYKAGKMISAGATGAVYEGTRKSDGQKVAIKCAQCIPLGDRYMEQEVYVNLLLKKPPLCPNIVEMFDWVQEPERYLMVMEYPYPCVTLERFIKHSGGALSEPVARDIMLQLIKAINYCLKRGIIHYDLHFGNVLVKTDTMQIKVIDFGNARVLKTTACDPRSRFMTESPPELRFINFDKARWTTVHCLGRALLLMVNGCFEALKPNVSKEVGDLIDQCMQASKVNRPTLEEMLQHGWFTKEELTYN